jgi:hypothetical protein
LVSSESVSFLTSKLLNTIKTLSNSLFIRLASAEARAKRHKFAIRKSINNAVISKTCYGTYYCQWVFETYDSIT